MKQKTPAKDAKRIGCKSLRHVARDSDTSPETLRNWFYNRYYVFVAVCEKVARGSSNG